jgi:TonB family protein
MVRMSAFAALLLAAAAPACAQTAWSAAPTAADMSAAYPAKARAEGIGGGVELNCTVLRSGALSDCAVLAEMPRGYGFGAAARRLAGQMKALGVPNGTELRIPITFSAELIKAGAMTVKTPKWTATPTAVDMQALVPKQTDGPNEARVTLVCDVQPGGALSGCAVDRETPAGQGFGAAVLALAPKFRADLMSLEGMPTVGAKVRLPVRFSLKPTEQAAK